MRRQVSGCTRLPRIRSGACVLISGLTMLSWELSTPLGSALQLECLDMRPEVASGGFAVVRACPRVCVLIAGISMFSREVSIPPRVCIA